MIFNIIFKLPSTLAAKLDGRETRKSFEKEDYLIFNKTFRFLRNICSSFQLAFHVTFYFMNNSWHRDYYNKFNIFNSIKNIVRSINIPPRSIFRLRSTDRLAWRIRSSVNPSISIEPPSLYAGSHLETGRLFSPSRRWESMGKMKRVGSKEARRALKKERWLDLGKGSTQASPAPTPSKVSLRIPSWRRVDN